MKGLTQIRKVIILTFCLLILLLNFHQGLIADCEDEEGLDCGIEAAEDCIDLCKRLADSTCDYTVFLWGWCDEGLCMQWFELYCVSGYLGDYEFECYHTSCPY